VPPSYLVLFVADRAEDSHAAALRELARGLKGAGFFDDPELGGERTMGTFMRTDTIGDPAALELIARMAELSGELELRIEVQHREEILGHLESGRPDAKLAAALGFGAP
jgi:hypothetical protein